MTSAVDTTRRPRSHPRTDRAARVRLQASDPLTAAGLRRWLRAADEAQMVRDGEQCDVLVLAVRPMPTAWLRRAVATARTEAAAPRVVVVVDQGAPVATTELGCDVVLSRAALTADDFVATVCAADATTDTEPAAVPEDDADERAATVLRMLADGHDLAEIASALFYSERTVKNVLYGYLGKVGARNRVHAVACAIRTGLV